MPMKPVYGVCAAIECPGNGGQAANDFDRCSGDGLSLTSRLLEVRNSLWALCGREVGVGNGRAYAIEETIANRQSQVWV